MNNSKLKIVQTRVIYKYNYVKAKIKIIILFRLVLDQLTLLREVLKRKPWGEVSTECFYSKLALHPKISKQFPSETDWPRLTC